MTYKVVDLRTEKVLGTFDTAEQAEKAESRLTHYLGESWYAIEIPVTKTTKSKKARVKKEGD